MKILLVNQCFYPDVVSAGQHLTDLAVELAHRGHKVTVVASRRGYDNPTISFPASEVWSGIDVRRVPALGMGKRSKLRRTLDFLSFYVCCFVQMMLLPRQDLVVMMTSPPLIAFAGTIMTRIKGGRLCVWVMDLNPDEAIAAGVLREGTLISRTLQTILGWTLDSANLIVVLDRFMRQKLLDKGVDPDKLVIVPPWSHEEAVMFDQPGRHNFRQFHGLADKFVVMYSGNHSPCHPLDTLLEAATRLVDNDQVRFCFIGGGSEFNKVKTFASDRRLPNVICLPYQPLETVSASLSAADLHVIVMGYPYVGIKHPCKIYNICALGIPFLFIGPEQSHVSDLVRDLGLQAAAHFARHGEIERVTAEIALLASRSSEHFDHSSVSRAFAQDVLVTRLAEALESRADMSARAMSASIATGR